MSFCYTANVIFVSIGCENNNYYFGHRSLYEIPFLIQDLTEIGITSVIKKLVSITLILMSAIKIEPETPEVLIYSPRFATKLYGQAEKV
jgi:hypothetical protein